MWFGSYNGLHKHEGTSIQVYNKSGKDSFSLSSKEIHPVFEDRLGFIWAGTTGGLDKLDPVSGIILHYKVKSTKRNDDYIGYIYTIFQDNKNDIWITTDVGMFVINYKTGNYFQVADNERSGRGMPDYHMSYKSTVATAKGIWMYTQGGMIFYDYQTRQFFHRYNNPLHLPVFNLVANSSMGANSEVCMDSANNICFVSANSLLIKYNLVTSQLDSFHFVLPKNAWECCYSLCTDFMGNTWIGFRYGGILLLDKSTRQFTSIRYHDANSLIQSDYIYSICQDYLNRVWVTSNNGIFIINYYDSAVQQKYLSEKKEFINSNYETGLISQDDKGNIYVPYNSGGLFQYNIFNGNNRYFPVADPSATEFSYVYTGEKDQLLISNHRTMLLADTSLHRIVLRMPAGEIYKTLQGYGNRTVWAVKTGEHAVYYKKANGIIIYDSGKGKPSIIQSQGFMKQACISKDKKYLYFISANGDLLKRDLVTLVTDSIPLALQIKKLDFSYANTRDIADDGKGNIWITSQNGLLKYNLQQKNISVYTTANGLLHDFTFSLCSDSKNRLWVGSMGGVNLYDTAKNAFVNVFTELADKQSDYFGSSLEAKDGHVYFLFGGKLVNINPEEFLSSHSEERLLKLNETRVNDVSMGITSSLAGLSYKQNKIYFRFGLMEFTEPEKVKYFYKLEGIDNNWTSLGNHSEVTFNLLQPGSYTLYIKAIDGYGKEVKQQLAVPFIIRPAFWQTWWFKLCCILLTGLIIYLFVQRKIRVIKEKDAVKQRMTELELKALRAQMNPHFIFNAMNSIQQFSLQNDIDNANKYLSRFSRLLRMVLQQSEHSTITLAKEIEMLEPYLEIESLRLGTAFNYVIDTDDGIETEAVLIPSMMIQPFIENALKHGLSSKKGEKKLWVKFTMQDENYLQCVIEDNGIGRKKAGEMEAVHRQLIPYQSMGMKLVTERLQIIEKGKNKDPRIVVEDLEDKEANSTGTRVTVVLPVG